MVPAAGAAGWPGCPGGGFRVKIGRSRVVCRQQKLCVERLGVGLFIKLIDLEIRDRHDTRQFCHAFERRPEGCEIAVNLDLDRLGHDRILLRIVARSKSHDDQPAAVGRVLKALKHVGDLTLFGQEEP